nr:MAG TPA: Insulin receptor [Caudoviricetes sp.]
MKIIIIIFFIIFIIWCIAGFIYDAVYFFRKKKSNEKEITIDLTEITK